MIRNPVKFTFAVAGGVVLATILMLSAVANVVESRDPLLAAKLMPLDGTAALRVAENDSYLARLAKSKGENSVRLEQMATREALRSLSLRSLNPRALRVFAMSANIPVQRKMAILEVGGRLSRRDTLTQLQLMQEASLQNRPRAAIAHLDAILRLKTAYQDAAGRGVAEGVRYPEFADEVAKMLRRSPPWKSLVFYYLLRESKSYDGFIRLHQDLKGQDVIPLKVSEEFSSRLISDGRFKDALEVAQLAGATQLHQREFLSDTTFKLTPSFPGSWSVFNSSVGMLTPLKGGGALLSLTRDSEGPLARRLVIMKPGKYQLRIRSHELTEPGFSNSMKASIEARMSCAANAAGIAPRRSEISVDKNCPYQWLWIYISQPPRIGGDIEISSISVRKQ